ncbi:MAG: hypothetical protein GX242_06300 [Clostridiales bacterium]|nr:hypothetical protein [Clostridiales bacterium]
MDRKQRAFDLFFAGYNCAQAVVGAFSDAINLEIDCALNLAIAFGAVLQGQKKLAAQWLQWVLWWA